MAWEKYMQTEGLNQHVCCQHCDSTYGHLFLQTIQSQHGQVSSSIALCRRRTSTKAVTDYELDQFRKDRLQLRKAGGPDRSNYELFRSLTQRSWRSFENGQTESLRMHRVPRQY
jgi:hypothetical protein